MDQTGVVGGVDMIELTEWHSQRIEIIINKLTSYLNIYISINILLIFKQWDTIY